VALKIHYQDDIENSIRSTLFAMTVSVIGSGGDVRWLESAVAGLQAQAIAYNLDWNEITIQVANQIKLAAQKPPMLDRRASC
jgi:hypothetical protein